MNSCIRLAELPLPIASFVIGSPKPLCTYFVNVLLSLLFGTILWFSSMISLRRIKPFPHLRDYLVLIRMFLLIVYALTIYFSFLNFISIDANFNRWLPLFRTSVILLSLNSTLSTKSLRKMAILANTLKKFLLTLVKFDCCFALLLFYK